MDGGPAAERLIEAKERMTKIAEIQEDEKDFSPRKCSDFEGEVTSIVPKIDKVEIDTETENRPAEKNGRTLNDEQKTKRLQFTYKILFGEGGYEILREHDSEAVHDPGKMGSLSHDGTFEELQGLGLIEENELTDLGSHVYSNWKGLEKYLSSRDRLQNVKDEIGEMEMPEFLRPYGVNVEDAHSYLSNPEKFENRWTQQHDGTVELYMITDALYSGFRNNGDTLRLLEDVKDGEVEAPESYEEIGIRGIEDRKEESLNLDGEKIYGKVLADYIHF